MTRPDDIDPAIWEAAEEAYLEAIYMTTSDEPQNMVRMVAVAIKAERERAALAACDPEKTYGTHRSLEYLNGYVEGRADAAKDIRNHPTAPRNAE